MNREKVLLRTKLAQFLMKTVLIGILNWGLGHATRCIPIIKLLEKKGVNIIIASDGIALALIQTNFPHLKTIELPSYSVQYQSKGSFVFQIAKQIPKLLKAINEENRFTATLVAQYKPDLIISDNRFGFYHTSIPSCFITHQLFLKPKGVLSLLAPLLNKWNHRFISKFSEVWVPDTEGINNLSGELSHQRFNSTKRYYIGWLSQFQVSKSETELSLRNKNSASHAAIRQEPQKDLSIAVAAILSGPEPQRTILENILIPQLADLGKRVLVIRGLPKGFTQDLQIEEMDYTRIIGVKEISEVAQNESTSVIFLKDYANREELTSILMQTKLVIARTGYTTLMDLAILGKKALLIPTPGQMEQEYLADRLMANEMFSTMHQNNLDLIKGLEKANNLSFNYQEDNNNRLSERIDFYLSHQ